MAIETGIASAVLPQPEIIAPGLPPAPPGGLPDQVAAADDMARFQAAMHSPIQPGGGAAGAAVEFAAPGTVAAPAGTPGDAILRGLQQMSERHASTVDRITQTLDAVQPGQSLPAADLLRLQMAVTEITMQQDITAKVVGKATQNLDTFLKNQ